MFATNDDDTNGAVSVCSTAADNDEVDERSATVVVMTQLSPSTFDGVDELAVVVRLLDCKCMHVCMCVCLLAHTRTLGERAPAGRRLTVRLTIRL
jgi:hypothetical protein